MRIYVSMHLTGVHVLFDVRCGVHIPAGEGVHMVMVVLRKWRLGSVLLFDVRCGVHMVVRVLIGVRMLLGVRMLANLQWRWRWPGGLRALAP